VVDQWGCGANSPNQLWALVANPSGGYSLQELYTGQYLGATTAPGGNGTKLSLQATQSANTAWTATSQG
jgi:Ricin-type beta-trefoil lectin domain-like